MSAVGARSARRLSHGEWSLPVLVQERFRARLKRVADLASPDFAQPFFVDAEARFSNVPSKRSKDVGSTARLKVEALGSVALLNSPEEANRIRVGRAVRIGGVRQPLPPCPMGPSGDCC